MTIKEAISQLNWLREDRESLCNGDPDDDEIWNADIEAIDVALKQMYENAELKRLLKLAVEDLHYFSKNGFEPCFKCDICEKQVTTGHRCKDMSKCNFSWHKLKECEQICKGDKHWRYLDEVKGLIENG